MIIFVYSNPNPMKKLLSVFAFTLLSAGIFTSLLRAQDIHYYITEHELPNLVNCLPPPPDTIGEAFTHDIMRYMWGKTQRLDPERLAQAKRDAIWSLDTVRVIYSEPFGYEIDPVKTPEIYRLFVDGVSSIEQIRFRPKAHYFRMRPYARFHESSIFPQDDEWLATEGSYPSGHTIRAWSAALVLAEVNPAAAEALFHRAVETGESRVIAGCHWQSDVDASASAACIGYSVLQANPEYRAQADRARAEFKRISGLPDLKSEFVCDFADWTPENEKVTGSTQGFAMYDRYAFVLHDKGRLCIFDMKKKTMVGNHPLTLRFALVFRSARRRNARVPKYHPLHFSFQITIMYPYAKDGAHRRLHDFRVIGFDGVFGGEDPVDAEPVGDADDRAQIAGIANAVESEDKFFGVQSQRRAIVRRFRLGHANHGQGRRRMGQLADARHRLGADIIDVIVGHDVKIRLQRLGHKLFSFDDEQTALIAELFLSQRLNLFYLVL